MENKKEFFGFEISNKFIIRIVLWLIAICLIFGSFSIVNEGDRGLRFTFGSVSNVVIEPGITFKIPIIQSIRDYTIRPMLVETLVEVGPNGAITKDNQTIGSKISMFYEYKEADLVKMYSNYGPEKINEILNSIVMESFKAVIGGYDIFALPTVQDEISKKVNASVNMKIASYPIRLKELKITNYDWSDEFDKQIAATMKKAQEVQQAKQELLITEQNAQKDVKKAEAEKQAMITKAEGEKTSAGLMAEAKYLEGEGIRKYNESLKTNLSIEIEFRKLEIDKIRAEKWNGAFVPTNNYGPIPIQTGRLQK